MELPAAYSGKWPTLLEYTTSARTDQISVTSGGGGKYKCTGARSQKQKWLEPHEVDDLVRAYESGMTVYELAKRFGCHRTTVSGHLQARGTAMRLAPMSEEDVDRASELYKSGLSFAEVGAALGRDGETIRQQLKRRGITGRGREQQTTG